MRCARLENVNRKLETVDQKLEIVAARLKTLVGKLKTLPGVQKTVVARLKTLRREHQKPEAEAPWGTRRSSKFRPRVERVTIA